MESAECKVNMKKTKSVRDGNRRLQGERLVYFHQKADEGYWRGVWSTYANPEYYQPFIAGSLIPFERIFTRHLSKQELILEAGCGTAQYVKALNVRGYRCIGLDYEIKAMEMANIHAGPLPLVCGDITALGMAENSFNAVISLGVVEHRRAGPEPFLEEMCRILTPGGTLLISVPYFNPLRRWRATRGAYQDEVDEMDFYQYAFTKKEFCQFLESAGFEVEKYYTYAHQKSLSQELHWLNKIPESLKKLFLRISKHIPYVNSQIGHMLMVIARKKRP